MTDPPREHLGDAGAHSDAATLDAWRRSYRRGAIGLFALLAAVAIAVAVKVADPSFGARGPFWLGGAVALVWATLLCHSFVQYRRVSRDVREGETREVSGLVSLRLSHTPGLVRLMRYRVRCGALRFTVDAEAFFRLRAGRSYRIRYTAHSQVFLGATLLPYVGPAPGDPLPVEQAAEIASGLLDREREVLELIADGLTNQEIADRLFLSVNTVKMYASQLYRKLGVRRRTEAVRVARRAGLLPREPGRLRPGRTPETL